jgi:hypothetical protein
LAQFARALVRLGITARRTTPQAVSPSERPAFAFALNQFARTCGGAALRMRWCGLRAITPPIVNDVNNRSPGPCDTPNQRSSMRTTTYTTFWRTGRGFSSDQSMLYCRW